MCGWVCWKHIFSVRFLVNSSMQTSDLTWTMAVGSRTVETSRTRTVWLECSTASAVCKADDQTYTGRATVLECKWSPNALGHKTEWLSKSLLPLIQRQLHLPAIQGWQHVTTCDNMWQHSKIFELLQMQQNELRASSNDKDGPTSPWQSWAVVTISTYFNFFKGSALVQTTSTNVG